MYKSDYYAANKERIKARQAKYRAANREKRREYNAKYMAANKEKISAQRAKFYIENATRLCDRQRKYYENNVERISLVKNKWYLANRERFYSYVRNRKAKKKAAAGKHTHKDVADLFTKQRGKCVYCKEKLVKSGSNKFHVDHIIPLSKGGSNWPHNIQLLCRPCNQRKHATDPIEWAQRIGFLI